MERKRQRREMAVLSRLCRYRRTRPKIMSAKSQGARKCKLGCAGFASNLFFASKQNGIRSASVSHVLAKNLHHFPHFSFYFLIFLLALVFFFSLWYFSFRFCILFSLCFAYVFFFLFVFASAFSFCFVLLPYFSFRFVSLPYFFLFRLKAKINKDCFPSFRFKI